MPIALLVLDLTVRLSACAAAAAGPAPALIQKTAGSAEQQAKEMEKGVRFQLGSAC
jgi:hypothetical protein